MEIVSKVEGFLSKVETKADWIGALAALYAGISQSDPVLRGEPIFKVILDSFKYELPYTFGKPHPNSYIDSYMGLPRPLSFLVWKWFDPGSSWSVPVKTSIAALIGAWIAKQVGVTDWHPIISRIISFIEKAGIGALIAGLIGGAIFFGSPSYTSSSKPSSNPPKIGVEYVYK